MEQQKRRIGLREVLLILLLLATIPVVIYAWLSPYGFWAIPALVVLFGIYKFCFREKPSQDETKPN